jgi:transcriptional regulator with XRE-family HTH domain
MTWDNLLFIHSPWRVAPEVCAVSRIPNRDRPPDCEDRPSLAKSESGSDLAPMEPTRGIEQTMARRRRRLHRLKVVRCEQGISLRSMARRLRVDVATVLQQEQDDSDLPLRILYQWQKALDVPAADLLVDPAACLSAAVMERARLVKVMKTSMSLLEKVRTNSQRRLVTKLIQQLLEIMLELGEVTAWNAIGQRRTLDELGRAIERSLPDDVYR